jgi:hypothetical protein
LVLLGASLPALKGQAPSQGIEQQLRSQYQLTRVGANGTVVGQPGSVLEMHEDGLIAIPASYGAYWYDTWKKGGRIKANTIQHVGQGFSDANNSKRPLQVGEKLYLVTMEFAPTEIVFNVQTCGACDLSVNPNDPPYRARLAFQFDKGYLSTADPKQVLEAVGQVFGLAVPAVAPPATAPAPTAGAATATIPPPAVSVVPLKLPSAYAKAQTPADQLQLNADNTFSLQEAGQTYSGTFSATGSTLKLSIGGGPETTATIQGNNLTDSSGQAWVLREQPAGAAPSGPLLHNDDIIKMVKADLDDAIIIAKISGSKCQFDTSTDALIQLKQGGVSGAVLKAMVGAAGSSDNGIRETINPQTPAPSSTSGSATAGFKMGDGSIDPQSLGLSGRWKFVSDSKSNWGSAREVAIDLDGSVVTIATIGSPGGSKNVYYTDGRPAVFTDAPSISGSAHWDGGALVIDGKQAARTGVVPFRFRYSVSADGRMLTRETKSTSPNGSVSENRAIYSRE